MPIEARRRSSGSLVAGLVAACALLSGAPPAPAQQPGGTGPAAPGTDGQGAAIATARPAGDALPSTTDLTARLSQGLRGAEAEVGTLLERVRASAARLEEQRRQIGQLALLKDDLERQLAETAQERDAAAADREARDQRSTALEAELATARQDAAAARQGLEQRAAEVARLGADVAALNDGRADLEQRLARAGQEAETRDRQLATLRDELEAARQSEAQVREQAAQRQAEADEAGRRAAEEFRASEQRAQSLGQQVAELGQARDGQARQLEQLRQAGADLGRQLAEAGQARDAAARDVQARDQRLASLQGELDGARRDAASATDRADGLDRRVAELEHGDADLRQQLAAARQAGEEAGRDLEARRQENEQLRRQAAELAQARDRLEAERRDGEGRIAWLEQALAGSARELEQQSAAAEASAGQYQALLARVNALAPARAAFVERARAELGDRPGVAFVGDRVVLETDPLFAGRHAMRLTREGEARLGAVARALAAVAGQVPADTPWVLRVEAYTDAAPPRAESAFRSNRALSAGRAAAAAEYLAGRGVAEERLSAVAMGAAGPLEAGAPAGGGRHERRLEIGLAPAEAVAEGGGQPAVADGPAG